MNKSLLSALATVTLGITSSVAQAQATAFQARHVPQAVVNGAAVPVGPMDSQQHLRLAINLPLRNSAELEQLLQDLYDPQSSLFHQYLSVDEFTQRFGPTEADYSAVVAWAAGNGFTVVSTTPNRRLVAIDGSVSTVNQALHVTMTNYQHPTESRVFFAPDREPVVVDLNVPLLQVTGMNNYQLPHSMLRKGPQPEASVGGSGPGGTYLPSDMRAAYYGNGPLTGAGQTIGIFTPDGYYLSDVQLFYSKTGMSSKVPINNRLVPGFDGACTTVLSNGISSCDDKEQVLDIVNAIGMAPGLTQLLVYEGPWGSDTEIFNLMATDNIAKSLSSSWIWLPADQASDDPIFQEFAVQGQSFFQGSGDSGDYAGNNSAAFPEGDAYVTSVGGTDLTTTGPGGSWVNETGWNNSGGGYLTGTTIPSWQQLPGVINAANAGSTMWRNAPDVAMEANIDNVEVDNGVFSCCWGGTSFAAPRWAGFMALVNQQAVANGGNPVGFINPKIYSIGVSGHYAGAFHDITSGSNGFNAVVGYDLVTGWGSPNGVGFIYQLAGTPKGVKAIIPIISTLLLK